MEPRPGHRCRRATAPRRGSSAAARTRHGSGPAAAGSRAGCRTSPAAGQPTLDPAATTAACGTHWTRRRRTAPPRAAVRAAGWPGDRRTVVHTMPPRAPRSGGRGTSAACWRRSAVTVAGRSGHGPWPLVAGTGRATRPGGGPARRSPATAACRSHGPSRRCSIAGLRDPPPARGPGRRPRRGLPALDWTLPTSCSPSCSTRPPAARYVSTGTDASPRRRPV